jgi:hypothetical protein
MTNTHTTDITLDPAVVETAVDTWLAAYCEPDEGRRAQLVAQVWAPDGELVDPPLAGAGHGTLVALAGAVLGQFPRHTFQRTSPIDAHHAYARYSWQLVAPDGEVAVAGLDVVEFGPDGKLRKVVGFFG